MHHHQSHPLREGWWRAGWMAALLAIVILAAACSPSAAEPNPGDPTAPPTSSPSTPTSIPGESPTPCDPGDPATTHSVDLDQDGVEELVYVDTWSGDETLLVVCIGDATRFDLPVEGNDITVAGFHDLDDDRPSEILYTRAADLGVELRAARLTLRGLQETNLSVERWSSAIDISNPGPFEGQTYQCLDWDDDGDIDLIQTQFILADDEVSVAVAFVTLDGLDVLAVPVDRFETTPAAALETFHQPDGCAPGDVVLRELRFSAAGWAVVPLDRTVFSGEEDLVITSVAADGERVVAVGTEAPNGLVGELPVPRPVAWWSPDGVAWNAASVAGADAEILDVAATSRGFVAVGRMGDHGAVWSSTDGAEWAVQPLDAAIQDGRGVIYSIIEAEGVGHVAAGAEIYEPPARGPREDTDAAVWLSVDGETWERIEADSFGAPGYQPNEGGQFNAALFDVAFSTGTGLVAVGYDSDDDPGIDYPPQYPAVWTSQDGRVWERSRLSVDARLSGVAAHGGRLLAYGQSDRDGSPTADAVIVASDDGQAWTAIEGPFSGASDTDGLQAIKAIRSAGDSTWFAVGSDQTEAEQHGGVAVWRSDDLTTWTRVSHDVKTFGELDAAPAPIMVDAAMTSDGAVVVVGSSGETMELPAGRSVCCLHSPQVWLFDSRQVRG